jgi:hypothetical protein
MKRFRIDFSIRETDCPPEDAQGIRFGDDVDVKDIFEFFNKCRDAAMTLFNSALPKKPAEDPELTKLKARIALLEMKNSQLQQENDRIKQAKLPHDQGPWEYRKTDKYRLQAGDRGIPDDGSRGGDGPPSKAFLEAIKHLNDPNKGRP